MNCLVSFTCGILLYASVFAGYACLFCPLIPLLLISNRLYRYLTDIIFSFWQLYPTALVEIVCNSKVEVYGDPVIAGENNIVIMNHRTRTEWIFLYAALYHCTNGHKKYHYPVRYILKDVLRHFPGPGWIMQLMCFLYLKREWSCDKKSLKKIISYFCDMSYKCCLVIFPEGTILTPENMKASYYYAEKNNLPKYDYVMHPKTKGFVYLTENFKYRNNLDAVYDITSVYPDCIPQNEWGLLFGDVPKKTVFFIKKYSQWELPSSEQGLREFIENCWLRKEEMIKNFYVERQLPKTKFQRKSNWKILYVALVFWTILPLFVLYSLYTYVWFRCIILFHTSFLLYLNYVCGYGFQEFEVNMYLFKKKFFKNE